MGAELTELNQYSVERLSNYLFLEVAGQRISTPYFINNIGQYFRELLEKAEVSEEAVKKVRDLWKNREIPFGWYRGKGTPEQLAEAVGKISEEVGLALGEAAEYGISEFMKLFGLGVDCSGLVYNILSYSFESVGKLDGFRNSLDWKSEERDVYNAGSFVFAGSALLEVPIEELQPLDLLLIRGRKDSYRHVALLVEMGGQLALAQSSIVTEPSGVTVSPFVVVEGRPQFEFKQSLGESWSGLFVEGKLEFRRLSCVTGDN